MLPKLLALDLDGTLLTSRHQISERSRRAIQRLMAQGTRVALCTGRPPRLMRNYASELAVTVPAIVYNGASLYDAALEQTTHLRQLSRERALAIIARARQAHPAVMIGLETSHGWYLDSDLYHARPSQTEPDGVGDVSSFIRGDVLKILLRHPRFSAAELAGALDDMGANVTWSSRNLLEVMHPQANKGLALERLAGNLGIASREVVAFGDQQNDVDMLRWAGVGIAMGNATADARAAADHITASNDAEGVALVLEGWLRAAGAPSEQNRD